MPLLKNPIKIFLGIIIILLSFLLFRSIIQPIRFNRDRDIRIEAAISKLKSIRKAQTAYKNIYGKYTDDFDTLINFIRYDSFEIQRKTGSYDPDMMNEAEAVKRGLIEVASTRISIHDSLFAKDDQIDLIRKVPYTANDEFAMDAGRIMTPSRVTVQVFEAYVTYETLLHGLNQQLVHNYIAERERIAGFPGLKVGSMTEATNNAGNWE